MEAGLARLLDAVLAHQVRTLTLLSLPARRCATHQPADACPRRVASVDDSRDLVGTKPTKPFAHGCGFFYSERLQDQAVAPPYVPPPALRQSLLDPAKPPVPEKPLASSWGRGGESGKHARWLSPRYLNIEAPHANMWLPQPNESRFLDLPPPWGPKIHAPQTPTRSTAAAPDGIAKRWPVMSS